MAIEYVMPKLAMAMNEGTVNEWLVQDGQYVEKGQDLATVETEKVAYDLESPQAGYFRIVLPPGETVQVETLIGLFAETEEELASLDHKQAAVPVESPTPVEQAADAAPAVVSPVPQVAPTVAVGSGERLKASPLARKMSLLEGLDLARVAGTGPGGRIVKRDIQQALQYGVSAPVADAGPLAEKARIPFTGLRATIAERMLASQQGTASLSSDWESDITDLLQMRKALVAKAEALGTKVSVNALLIRALVYAIRQVPIANAALIDGEIRIYDSINVGIAVSVPGRTEYDSGLMVPVLKGVEKMGLVEIDKGMKALVEKVRSGGFDAQDLVDSTITLSSTAGIAPPGLTTAPVLNLPNAVIVGPSTPKDKPVVVDGEIQVRTLMPLSMTFDHRILDGEPAARFMRALHECLESPELMLA